MTTTFTIRQKNKNKGILTWYLRTCTNGKESFESLHTTKKGEAIAILNSVKMKAAIPEESKPQNQTIKEGSCDWLSQIAITYGSRSKTALAYTCRLKNWTEWCEKNRLIFISDFHAKQAYNFVKFLSEKFAPKTITEIIKVVKSCVQWVCDTNNIEYKNPFKSIKPPKQKKERKEFWTIEEVEQILSVAPSLYYKALWALMAYAGLRFNEARTLRISNIKNGIITIINGKGGKNAEVPISNKLEPIIAPLLQNTEELLIPKDSVPKRSDKAILHLKIAVKTLGLNGEISHHKLRHSFASELLRKGVNPRTVQELMRHSSIDTLFDYYAHILRSDLADAVNKI